jgi:hypothetical protein
VAVRSGLSKASAGRLVSAIPAHHVEELECSTVTLSKIVRQSFDHVNNHRWDALLKLVASHVHHRFASAHAIGGERHDKEAMHRWLERVGRVLPTLHLTVNHIWVKGWPPKRPLASKKRSPNQL